MKYLGQFSNNNDIATKKDLPTVNNNTITITQGGVTKGSFTLNQSSDTTIDVDAGGGGGGNLPTTSTAGQVLKSTSTEGTVEWGYLDACQTIVLGEND